MPKQVSNAQVKVRLLINFNSVLILTSTASVDLAEYRKQSATIGNNFPIATFTRENNIYNPPFDLYQRSAVCLQKKTTDNSDPKRHLRM